MQAPSRDWLFLRPYSFQYQETVLTIATQYQVYLLRVPPRTKFNHLIQTLALHGHIGPFRRFALYISLRLELLW